MPVPIIENPYSKKNKLIAEVNNPFSARLNILHNPTSIIVLGNIDGWSHSWLQEDEQLELFITPAKPLLNENGLQIIVSNKDGANTADIPYEFIE